MKHYKITDYEEVESLQSTIHELFSESNLTYLERLGLTRIIEQDLIEEIKERDNTEQ